MKILISHRNQFQYISAARTSAYFPILIILVCSGAIFLYANICFASPKKFPEPKWLNSIPVAEKIIINGVPSTVKYFEVYKEVDELLKFYRHKWDDGTPDKPGYREANVYPWHIISRLDGHYLYTVQVKKSDSLKIKGYLAVADLKKMRKEKNPANNIAKMDGSKIINDVTSFDPGKKGRTLLLVNKYSVASNSTFYKNYYRDRGWGKLIDMDGEDSQVLAFQKFGKETHLVITRISGSTNIVMNIVENN